MQMMSNPLRFGAALHIKMPGDVSLQKPSSPSLMNISSPNLRGVADILDNKDEYSALIGAIDDQKDPQSIQLNVSWGPLASATISTHSNGKEDFAQNAGEALSDFVKRLLTTAKNKAANLVTPEEKVAQRKTRLTETVSAFNAALATGTFQKLSDVEQGYNSSSVGFIAKVGDKEYEITKRGLAYSQNRELDIRTYDGNISHCLTMWMTGGPEPPGLSSGRAPQPEKLSLFGLYEYSPSGNHNYIPPDTVDENTDPNEALAIMTLRNDAKKLFKALFFSDLFPAPSRY